MKFKVINRVQPVSNHPHRNDIPPDDDVGRTFHDLVSAGVHEMESAIDLEDSGRRHRYSLTNLCPAMCFHPADFDDRERYAKWLKEDFYPLMVILRIERGLCLEYLREQLGHFSGWMSEYNVDGIIVRRFKKYVSLKNGKLWDQLVESGGMVTDEKPRLTPENILLLLHTTDVMVKNPSILVSTNQKYLKKKGEKKARYRIANNNIALNLHAVIRIAIIATKRPTEVANIHRTDVGKTEFTAYSGKVHRRGEPTTYDMWTEYYPSIKRLLDSHDGPGLFSLNPTSLSNWVKSLMVHCGFNHNWFNLHRLRSFSGDLLALGGATHLEMMAHGDWGNYDSVDTYISEVGRKENLKRASKKKYLAAKAYGLVPAPTPNPKEILIDMLLMLNENAGHDEGMHMTYVDTPNETIGEFLNRTGTGNMFGIDENGEPEKGNSDVASLLNVARVDTPRFELGASTMPR